MKRTVQVFDTHIEVTPYILNDEPALELLLSRKDKPTHSLIPIAYYWDRENETLYLPRGVDLAQLEYMLRTQPEEIKNDRAFSALKH